jgi:hypothetical protein
MVREFFRKSAEFVCGFQPGWVGFTGEGRADRADGVFLAGVFVGVEELGSF